MGAVEDTEAVRCRIDVQYRVGGAVYYRRVEKCLGPPGWVRGIRYLRRFRIDRFGGLLTERIKSVIVRYPRAGSIPIRVGDGTERDHRRGPEPGTIMPAAEWICPAEIGIKGVLGGHVDMRPPEVAGNRNGSGRVKSRPQFSGLAAPYPGGVGPGSIPVTNNGSGIDEGLVLDNKRNGMGAIRYETTADQGGFRRIGNQVPGDAAGIHAEAGDTPGMFVIEHQPGTLGVGPVIGLGARAGIIRGTGISSHSRSVRHIQSMVLPACIKPHIRDIGDTGAFCVIGVTGITGGYFTGRGNPLMGGAVTDPRCTAAMQMEYRTVLAETVLWGLLADFRRSQRADPIIQAVPGPEPMTVVSVGIKRSPS